MRQEKAKVGLVGVGLDTYWGQFPELLPRLLSYQDEISDRLKHMNISVINLGMIDTPQKAVDAALQLKKADVEFVFLFISTNFDRTF